MIENVITRGMWAFSPDDEQVLHSLTVYINTGSFRRPYVTAEIALSRTMGSGASPWRPYMASRSLVSCGHVIRASRRVLSSGKS